MGRFSVGVCFDCMHAGLIVNRLCGSGFQAVVSAAQEILLGSSISYARRSLGKVIIDSVNMNSGETQIAVAGGTESMSQAPYILRGTRWGMLLFHRIVHKSKSLPHAVSVLDLLG